jgi:V/A-type H+-transporting ATPase subunit D
MILKEAIEEKRAEDARAVRTFGDSSEAPAEV